MDVTRHDIREPRNGMACMSRVVVHGGIVYVCGITADPVRSGIKVQTQQILDRIDGYLKTGGTDKSRLLTAQIWITDMALFEDMNSVWNAWIDVKNPPVRACVRADLYRPELLVEIMVTAAA
jgi:enamine deaminase RidA (YjgF/YER057c/UK114 family)